MNINTYMLKMRHGRRNASEIEPATEAMQNETDRKTTRKLTVSENCRIPVGSLTPT